jgi:hypothetical protein
MFSPSVGSLAIVVGLWAILTIVCCSSSSPKSSSRSRVPVTAEKLIDEYKANEVGADAFYKDRSLEVTGIIENIGKDILDTPYVTLTSNGNQGIPAVQCMFDDNPNMGQLGHLKQGAEITVVGTCQGKMMNVLLRGCSIQ